MRRRLVLAAALFLAAPAASVRAQAIIAHNSGLPSADHVIDFGANLYPNFTNITTQFTGIAATHTAYFTIGSYNNLVGGFLTSNGSGLPNTLTIKFGTPISD